MNTNDYDFFTRVTLWMYYMNFEPRYGSERISVFYALKVNNKFIELSAVSEFFIFSIDFAII